MIPDPKVREAALRWAALTGDPDFADWEGFTDWLEADPAHARAYDEVQYAVTDAAEVMETVHALAKAAPAPANDNPPFALSATRPAWIGAAIAAALVLVASFVLWPATRGETLYTTVPGETRLIALGEGSKIELGGDSRLAIPDEGARRARLESGQALFTIRHDAADPFVLTVGGARLVDAGTVFDVRTRPDGLALAVAEGAVVVNPRVQALRVEAGHRAVLEDGRLTVSAVEPAEVGEWARGRITFRDAGPAEVAAELSRATGLVFRSSGGAARISGSIALDQVRSDPASLAPILGMRVQREGEAWVIAAR
ncbi:MAG: DUF4880 domain-containing protein [Porphyrobacter sp.]|nr:DUF4880 domain-containing protein [Porphyrobacter sp.]